MTNNHLATLAITLLLAQTQTAAASFAAFSSAPIMKSPAGRILARLESHEDLATVCSTENCAASRLTLVLFGSKYCGLCRALLPRARTLANQVADGARIYQIEYSDDTAEAFRLWEITATPSFVLLDDAGLPVETGSGMGMADFKALGKRIRAILDDDDAERAEAQLEAGFGP